MNKNPLLTYFQSPLADTFKNFAAIKQPNSTLPLPATPNFGVVIIPEKIKAIKSIEDLRASETQVIVDSNRSRIEAKNIVA